MARRISLEEGRLTPSMKINMDHQGDALDEFLVEDSHIQDDGVILSVVDDFTILELPSGQNLVINFLTTWGDQYYVGLNGVEIFNSSGIPVQISSITAKPCDIKVLQEYNTDPRVVSNLIDGVYFTRLHKVKSHQTVIQITKKRVLIKFNIKKMMGPVGYPEIIYRSSIKDLHAKSHEI
ncbi:katanin-interacting protein-like isoform X2 [Xenia sp. Carnegie-2017]|uniref:katanin-interacting protein-like isoform X2 n=1 Tax=Xenia sp. Carnegie-2017 TaxID=2897299 RepID=UPI001F04C047|nr:katanin-interacting protein-like isoform X2 [Xenia sp. Carnegie-2017]